MKDGREKLAQDLREFADAFVSNGAFGVVKNLMREAAAALEASVALDRRTDAVLAEISKKLEVVESITEKLTTKDRKPLVWTVRDGKIVADGRLEHSRWLGPMAANMWATSGGIDHGPYLTIDEANKACEQKEAEAP